ncbi:hypothetical protein [Hymenobacter sedentarius]|uniref:hypothetical protein n=1 Tax=Hymenobacter sedentarius TaxID=1411621 RepID=UPI0012FD500C|nr:hypothetical protein [Hymenobacter sedentarius]
MPSAPPPPPGSIDRTDSTCRAELRRAHADAQRGQLTYFLFRRARYADDLDTFLRRYGLRFRYNPMNCTLEDLCYAHYMDSVIARGHGPAFLDRLKQKADQRFLSAWPTRNYWYWDLDVPPRGRVEDVEAYVTAHLPRPRGWDTRPELGLFGELAERQYLFATLTVDRTGQLGSIRFPADRPGNVKATNRRFLPAIQREIRRLIRTAGPWQAGQLAGHAVSATLYVDVTLNPEQMPRTPDARNNQ